MGWYSKAIAPEDEEAMVIFAERLKAEPDKQIRLMMQIRFVQDMSPEYGRDRAAKMLNKVWKMAKARA